MVIILNKNDIASSSSLSAARINEPGCFEALSIIACQVQCRVTYRIPKTIHRQNSNPDSSHDHEGPFWRHDACELWLAKLRECLFLKRCIQDRIAPTLLAMSRIKSAEQIDLMDEWLSRSFETGRICLIAREHAFVATQTPQAKASSRMAYNMIQLIEYVSWCLQVGELKKQMHVAKTVATLLLHVDGFWRLIPDLFSVHFWIF